MQPPGQVPPPGQPSNPPGPPQQSGPPAGHPGAHPPGSDYNQRPGPPPGAAPSPNQQSKWQFHDIFSSISNNNDPTLHVLCVCKCAMTN